MFRTWTLAACAAASLSAAPAFAQGTPTKMAVSDALFAATAADGGMTEVLISQIGAKKATNPELKKYSERMIAEHTKANEELKAIAARKGMTLPAAVTAGHQFCEQNLLGLSGEEFDCAYAMAQEVVHKASVAAFEAEAERGQDPDVKAFAAKYLPHIKEHTMTIKPIAMEYEKKKMEKEGQKPHGE